MLKRSRRLSSARAIPLLLLFLAFDAPFFVANVFKLFDGGWVPVLIGIVLISAMLIWSKGRETILARATGLMGRLAESLFPYLQRNAVAADRQFGIPPSQAVGIGAQIDLLERGVPLPRPLARPAR